MGNSEAAKRAAAGTAASAVQTKSQTKLLAYIGLVVVAAIYGGWAIVAKAAMSRGASPFIFALYRAAGGSVLLTIPLLVFPGLTPDNNTFMEGLGFFSLGADRSRILLLGVLMAGNVAGFVAAAQHLPAMTISVLQPCVPITTAVLSYFFFGEEMGFAKVISIACSATGAVCVVLFADSGNSKTSHASEDDPVKRAIGVAFIAMNIFCVSTYFVLQKEVLRRYSPVWITASSYWIATLVLLPVALVSLRASNRGGWHEWALFEDQTVWLCVAYGIGFTTAVNYSVLGWANQVTTPTTVTSSALLQPLFGSIMSWLFLSVMLTTAQAVGGMFIVVGLCIYARAMSTAESNDEAEPLAKEMSRLSSLTRSSTQSEFTDAVNARIYGYRT